MSLFSIFFTLLSVMSLLFKTFKADIACICIWDNEAQEHFEMFLSHHRRTFMPHEIIVLVHNGGDLKDGCEILTLPEVVNGFYTAAVKHNTKVSDPQKAKYMYIMLETFCSNVTAANPDIPRWEVFGKYRVPVRYRVLLLDYFTGYCFRCGFHAVAYVDPCDRLGHDLDLVLHISDTPEHKRLRTLYSSVTSLSVVQTSPSTTERISIASETILSNDSLPVSDENQSLVEGASIITSSSLRQVLEVFSLDDSGMAVIYAQGVDIFHLKDIEPALDPSKSVWLQRHVGNLNNAYSRVVATRVPVKFTPTRCVPLYDNVPVLKYGITPCHPSIVLFNMDRADWRLFHQRRVKTCAITDRDPKQQENHNFHLEKYDPADEDTLEKKIFGVLRNYEGTPLSMLSDVQKTLDLPRTQSLPKLVWKDWPWDNSNSQHPPFYLFKKYRQEMFP